mmetsp:Transcript_25082/g.59456  ORF Transcript_25082/g.59456 Transcript_25082/m.59456 type:complete len:223 (-) Transcript_25082:546-1214(-)
MLPAPPDPRNGSVREAMRGSGVLFDCLPRSRHDRPRGGVRHPGGVEGAADRDPEGHARPPHVHSPRPRGSAEPRGGCEARVPRESGRGGAKRGAARHGGSRQPLRPPQRPAGTDAASSTDLAHAAKHARGRQSRWQRPRTRPLPPGVVLQPRVPAEQRGLLPGLIPRGPHHRAHQGRRGGHDCLRRTLCPARRAATATPGEERVPLRVPAVRCQPVERSCPE